MKADSRNRFSHNPYTFEVFTSEETDELFESENNLPRASFTLVIPVTDLQADTEAPSNYAGSKYTFSGNFAGYQSLLEALSYDPYLRTFPRFKDLPEEIQVMIVALAMPPPRIFQFQIDNSNTDSPLPPRCFGTYQIPSILHVDRFFRAEGLAKYRQGGFGEANSVHLSQEYWVSSLDTIYFPRFLPHGDWPRSQPYEHYQGAQLEDIDPDEYNFPPNEEFDGRAIWRCLSEIGNVRHLAVPFDHQRSMLSSTATIMPCHKIALCSSYDGLHHSASYSPSHL
jgi:hypothetical protein